MKKNILSYIFLFVSLSSFSQVKDYTSLVDPFIGTGGHGHTYPGASMPFGMMQLSPDTRLTGWDGCSGYHYSDSVIYGFTHTHLSGTGCSDYGDILLMPMSGSYSFDNAKYSSSFSHENETASPGYYSVSIDNGVQAELSVSKRSGMHQYIFPEGKTPYVILDLQHRDEVIESYVEVVNDSTIQGLRRSKAWATDQWVYFIIRFSQPIVSYGLALNDTLKNDLKKTEGKNVKAYFSFKNLPNNILKIKIAISAVSIEGAMKNLTSEIPGWDFIALKEAAKNAWNKELGKIDIEGGTTDQQKVFYTSLYHSLLNPNLYSDMDGQYRGRDNKIHTAVGFDYYTVFSLWDTYRALHPLLTIIDKKRTNDFINTFIKQYEQSGLLPVWELSANETNCMIGYHAVSVIADAFLKGIKGYDTLTAFEAMKHSANTDLYGLGFYRKYGYVPGDKESESVSRTLEYAYDDWCIAQTANKMGYADDYANFIKRAQSYKNIFDPSTSFIRAKTNGGWYTPFIPAEVNFNYTEANGWQYNFYVPQDISGFAELTGGKQKFSDKLDSLFYGKYKLSGREQADITGLIGQYAHGNEPSQHIAYLYNYVGKPWKTQELVHKIQTEMYSEKPDGLCGNEDCGQMSAWYVLSAMGFYQVCPGNEEFAFGTPLFRKVTLNLENGKDVIINAKNVSDKNYYIQSAALNGMDYQKSFITYSDIMKGGELSFEMKDNASNTWAVNDNDCPKTSINEFPVVPVPYVVAAGKTFYDKMTIELKTTNTDEEIFYTLDGTNPDSSGVLYTGSFEISAMTTLRTMGSIKGWGKSFVTDANFYKVPQGRSIIIKSKYNSQYTAGGDNGLIDYIRGENNFRLGGWQGYQGQDFEAVVDLGKNQKIKKITAGFLQDIGSWIWFPSEVEYAVSVNGTDFKVVSTIKNTFSDKDYTSAIKDFSSATNVKARYVRVKAKNYGTIPSWHLGAGGEAFIFIDEIIIE
ncbi:MAG: GH92 family glycosyl hydrolase [Bacteroidota bacterium]